jgi:hypothetical protein
MLHQQGRDKQPYATNAVRGYPLCPAGHLPLKGGDWLGALFPPHLQPVEIGASGCRDSISPLEGEMPGRAEGGKRRPLASSTLR